MRNIYLFFKLITVVLISLSGSYCSPLKLNNPSSIGDESFLAMQELRCLLGQDSLLCSSSGGPAASKPSFSPAPGTFFLPQTVSLSTSTPGATICYSTNGTSPTCDSSSSCTSGVKYSSSVTISSSSTLLAIACKSGFSKSAESSGMFAILQSIFVSTTGNDSNNGLTPATAKATIPAAIAVANAQSVLVEAGTYNVNSGISSHVILKEGVSLYGGYSVNFASRNPATNITTITDTSSAAATQPSPNRTIEAGAGITNATIVDGFTLNGSAAGGGYCSTVYTLNGSPTISGNTINYPSGATASYTVFVSTSAAPLFINNVIIGNPAGVTYTIFIKDASPVIRNNTVDGGANATAIFVSATTSSSPSITNNILVTANNFCQQEGDVNSDPSAFTNNELFGCTTLYIDEGGTPINNLLTSVVNSATQTLGFWNNVTVNPVFVNQSAGDYHLQAGSPVSVSQGGIDLTASIPKDKDGNARTVPMSMGAYEY